MTAYDERWSSTIIMMNGDGMDGMGLMWFFGLLVLVGVTVLGVVLVKALSGKSSHNAGPDTRPGRGVVPGRRGTEILEERYAHGELSTEEYRERLKTLEEDGQ
ncbi:SHOCT domain-containing protein [Arthrobacter sp. 35/47]|uniref:SHOCT domain-containing protein n=1 Tax=Arthrobacter sp. 35/47 TaxID=269454 RepID=UPI0020A65C4E|nr:SHOCT domain-containing protein [Arthrobacter sp. 35/47]